jgi:hypothetical protein
VSRVASALITSAFLALAVTACGGGGSSTDSTHSPPSRTALSAEAGVRGKKNAESERRRLPQNNQGHPGSSKQSGHSSAGRGSGAAAFRVHGADNSVPNYGSEGSASQKELAGAVLSKYLNARAHGDWSTACSLLATNVQKRLPALLAKSGGGVPTCPRVLEALAKTGEGNPSNPMIGSLAALRIGHPYAFALFYGPKHQKYADPMVKEGESWKVVQIVPFPYPPGSVTPGG